MKLIKKDAWTMFNQISRDYDRINRILSFGLDRRWRRQAALHLPQRKQIDLLDIAAGTGDQIISCFDSHPFIHSCTGVDLSLDMLQIAQQKINSKPFKHKVALQHADAMALPFSQSCFDAATCSFGIRNLPDPLQALRELHRVLNHNGKCLILEFSLPKQPLKWFYLFYLRHILPWIGKALSKHTIAYRYLNETIESFPYGNAFCNLMKNAGFTAITALPMTFGAVTLYTGEKP